jgi:antirestriction protein
MTKVYVGTYAKYNSGSLFGQWIDLEQFSNGDDFEAACQELHGEGEHEFMFQDWEGIPENMITESSLSDEFWDWLVLEEDDKELLSVYRADVDSNGDIDEARNSFSGKYASPEEWAESYADDTGMLSQVPADLRYYFDFKAWANDARLGGDVVFVDHGRETWVFQS